MSFLHAAALAAALESICVATTPYPATPLSPDGCLRAVAQSSLRINVDATGGRRRIIGPPPLRELGWCEPGIVVRASPALDVAVDDRNIYYTTESELLRIPKNGGQTPEMLFTGRYIGLMTVDETSVFFGAADITTGVGSVMAVNKDGGEPRFIIPDIMYPYGIANDARYVYVVSIGTPISETRTLRDGKIVRVTKDGSEIKTLASGLPPVFAFTVRGEDAFYGEVDHDAETATLNRISIHGGRSVRLLDDVFVLSLTTDGNHVYFSAIDLEASDAAIWRISSNDETATVIVPHVFAQHLRVSGSEIYYASIGDEGISINAAPLAGDGSPRVVAHATPSRLLVDDCLLYYSNGEGIQRVPR
jgi:hypothetical protein